MRIGVHECNICVLFEYYPFQKIRSLIISRGFDTLTRGAHGVKNTYVSFRIVLLGLEQDLGQEKPFQESYTTLRDAFCFHFGFRVNSQSST